MKKKMIKRLLFLILLTTLFHSMAFAQSKSVFLNLKVGQSTYQDAVTQIKNSTYRNFMKIRDGKIFIVGTSVKQNGGKVWDHADIFFKDGYVNNIHFHSASVSGHSVEYINKKYQEIKNFFIPQNGYSFWLEKDNNLYYKYKGCAVILRLFDSDVAGKVVDVQYIAL